jgi:predicted site-specific integrase-resolvase
MLNLSRMTLHRYIAAGKISPPPLKRVGGVRVRLWTGRDLKRVHKQLPKIRDGRRKKKKA